MSKLYECVEILDSKRIPLSSSQRERLEKTFPYYGAQGIIDYVDNYLFDGEYILVAEDGNNLKSLNENVATWATGKFWVNNHAHILGSKEGYNLRFIYYMLNCMDLRGYITGSAQPKLNQENLAQIELCLPSKETQDKVADILSLVDDKIANNNAICADLEAMAKLLYDYWFVQFDFPDKNGRPYKSSGGKMVWSEELKREIPEGWGVKSLPDASDVRYGFPLSTELFSDEGQPVIRIRDILDTSISAHTSENVSDEYLTKSGDLLVGMDGNFQMNYWSRSGDVVNQRITRIRKTVLPIMVVRFQIEPVITAKVTSVARSTVGHLGDSDIKGLKIIVPHDALNYSLFESAADMICSLRNENRELASLREFLLPLLMNGQVGFKED